MPTSSRNNIELVIFDWDGTICDSIGKIVTAFIQTAMQLDFEVLSRSKISEIIGLKLNDAIGLLYPSATMNQITEFSSLYSKNYRLTAAPVLYPGMRDLLVDLLENDISLCIATGKSSGGLDRDLRSCNLSSFFKKLKTSDTSLPKPHPNMIIEICDELFIDLSKTVMVGDTEFDILMARNAGIKSIAVTYGAHLQPKLLAAKPDLIASSTEELKICLKSMI